MAVVEMRDLLIHCRGEIGCAYYGHRRGLRWPRDHYHYICWSAESEKWLIGYYPYRGVPWEPEGVYDCWLFHGAGRSFV